MSEINIKAELKKGYLMYRAFEHGMKLADEIDNLDSAIQTKKKELELVTAKLGSSSKTLDKELDKIANDIEALRKKEIEDLDLFKKENAAHKEGLNKKLSSINEAIKKAETTISSKTKEVTEIDVLLAQRKADLDLFNKEIEDTKAKFKSMF